MEEPKKYTGRVPACGVFCGKCPLFIREKNPCLGAGVNIKRCLNCQTFHQCCVKQGVTHCYQCKTFPCQKFKEFSRGWNQYGQNFIENQQLLKKYGEVIFLEKCNEELTKL